MNGPFKTPEALDNARVSANARVPATSSDPTRGA
jgi:hypothetical protein